MKGLQRRCLRPRSDFLPRFQLREVPNFDLPVPDCRQLRFRYPDLSHLLVKESRQEKKIVVAKTKSLAPLGNSAFAQENRLFAAAQRFADQRPFLETDALHFARPKLASPRWPSTSTSIRILFSRGTASPARRRTSPPPAKKACTRLPSRITTLATRLLTFSRRA